MDNFSSTLTSEVIIANAHGLQQTINAEIDDKENLTSTDIDDIIDVDINSFRIQNSMIHLTYKSHIVFDDWLEFIKKPSTSRGKPRIITEYSMVHEEGSKDGYLHTHILFKFNKAFQSKNPRIFDFLGIHPNIKKVMSRVHWERVVKYHRKQGTPFVLLKEEDQSIIKRIWSHDSKADALVDCCRSTADVGGVLGAFAAKPIDHGPEPEVDWRQWQKDLMAEISEIPDDRTINWIWDPVGYSGKSSFAKHFGKYKDAFVSTTANIYHVATQLQEQIKNGDKAILIAIFNFSRQTEKLKIYQALESLKDGMITSQKYRGTTMFLQHPHVVVFANYLPDVSKVTRDRWKIRTINNCTHFKHHFTAFHMENWISTYKTKCNVSYEAAEAAFSAGIVSELTPIEMMMPDLNDPKYILPAFSPPATPDATEKVISMNENVSEISDVVPAIASSPDIKLLSIIENTSSAPAQFVDPIKETIPISPEIPSTESPLSTDNIYNAFSIAPCSHFEDESSFSPPEIPIPGGIKYSSPEVRLIPQQRVVPVATVNAINGVLLVPNHGSGYLAL